MASGSVVATDVKLVEKLDKEAAPATHSQATSQFLHELETDAEKKDRAIRRSHEFKVGQRFVHDVHGTGTIVDIRSADSAVVIKFDDGSQHTYELGSQRKLKPNCKT